MVSFYLLQLLALIVLDFDDAEDEMACITKIRLERKNLRLMIL